MPRLQQLQSTGHEIDGHRYEPGDRVILTEWLDGPGSETHVLTGTFVGTMADDLGTMVVVNDPAIEQDVVLAISDIVAIDPLG
ncbi:MAG: hypothetical protein LC798_11165 [Chloroflexi bacterium]|nr:hypothetical protein [Chloroflexota bacterium]